MDEYEKKQWLIQNIPDIKPNNWAKFEGNDTGFMDEFLADMPDADVRGSRTKFKGYCSEVKDKFI